MSAQVQLSYVEQAYDRGREHLEQIVGYLQSEETAGMTHSELERELEKKGRELMRRLCCRSIWTAEAPAGVRLRSPVPMERFAASSGSIRS